MEAVMERTGALVEDSIVRNIIVWGDESEAQYESEGWDYAVETTDLAVKPGIGWTYTEPDGFRPPQPFPSWVWSKKNEAWEAPTPMPTDGGQYEWNETTQTWDEILVEESPANP